MLNILNIKEKWVKTLICKDKYFVETMWVADCTLENVEHRVGRESS